MVGMDDGKSYKHVAALDKLGIHWSVRSMYTKYKCKEKRLKTYEHLWPVSMKQEPDKLSEAGFFYTGKGDQTVCFHCGGGLKDWKINDDPFVEHALWFPKCSYIQQLKGKEFVEKVAGDREALIAGKEVENIDVPPELKEAIQMRNPESSSSEFPVPSQEAANKITPDQQLCKICYQEQLGIVFLPCGHLVACVKCAMSLNTCAVCRKAVSATVRTYIS